MKRKLNQLLIASALLAPTSVFALGMGQMQVRSALNQPLNARINLQAVGDYEIEQLSAQLASAQAFTQSGLERPRFLSDLQFSIQTSPDGNSFIQITSNRPIREPIVNFLLELEWPQGRLIREFAAFLDPEPSVIAPPGQAVAAAPPPLPATRTPAEPASQPQTARPTPPPRPTFAPLQTDVPLGTATYQVPSGDTLWGIAQRSRPHPSVSTQRMMEAIFLANPNAFTRSSMDNLSAGAVLRIPSVQEIDPSIDPSEAVARVPTPPAARPTPVTPAAPATPATPTTTATPFEPEAEQPQVRLVPPEAEAQTPATAAAPATAMDPALAIPLDQGRLKLKVAGLDDIRSRVANMDSAALSAMQQGEPTPLEPVEPEEPSPATEVSPEPLTAETQPTEAEPVSEAIEPVTPAPETPELATATPEPEPVTLPEPQVEFQEVTPEPITAPQVEGTTPEPLEPLTAEAPQTAEGEVEAEPEVTEPQPETAVTEPVEATQPAETAETTEAQAEQPSTEATGPAGWLRNPVTWALAGFAALLLIVVPLLRRRQRVEDREEPLFVGEQPTSAEDPDERPTTLLQKASDEPVTALAPSEDEGITRPMPLQPDEERTQTVMPNPLERVELLLTAGRYTDAENVIRHALAEDPDNAVLTSKLLDIHYATKNRDAFVEEAEALHNRFEDKSGPLWTRIARMGRELAPEHALFASATQFPPTRLSKTSLDEAGQPQENITDTADTGVDGLDFDVPERSSLIDDTQPPRKAPEALSGLDWQLPDMEPPTGRTGKPSSKVNPSPDSTVEKPVLQDDFEAQLQNVDFDFEPVTEVAPEGDREPNTGFSDTDDLLNAEIPNTEMPRTEMPDTEMEMPNLDFALEEKATSIPIDGEKETSISAMSAASEDYVETKLDLAVAYLEMGDALGARTLLEEVVQEGSPAQKQRAEEYMGKLR